MTKLKIPPLFPDLEKKNPKPVATLHNVKSEHEATL